ncbi:unnamed protein product [Linum tenue]|uniref:Essential protein Yae1 N-terminal domain-containing protein n=1 Tax=Linum tenue TaxID=586396 RepID=A0AAV0P013_9ROSI|nr:unnamed protein product [Linum tenue]
MDTSFAKELYSESLELSTAKLNDPVTAHRKHSTDLHLRGHELLQDSSLCEGDFEDDDDWSDKTSDLDRVWQKRRSEFYAIGYRDGLIAGKEAIAQEGFNNGFKQSVIAGYNWGTVRGVTSAFSSLPDSLKEKLVQTEEKRKKFQELHELVNSITTTNALKLFHEDVLAEEAAGKKIKHNETGENPQKGSSSLNSRHFGQYAEDLHSLLHDSPAIESNLLAE